MEGNGRTQEPGQQSDSQPLMDSSNKAPGNKGQIENARLRRKQLEKRREELYGGTHLHMDVDEKIDAVETKDDPVFAEWASRCEVRAEDVTLKEYFRSLAMPEIRTFHNENSQKFEDFIRAFNLKYPERAYAEVERKEILAGYLGGEAKLHYNTLPGAIKNGPFEAIVRELKERMRVENQETQAEALREMRMIRKKENQTVVQFCLELELLSSKAYPSCDAAALALIRAEVLHEQLRDWPEAYHLSEILANEDMRSVYERMKDAALRIEHLRRQRRDFSGRRFSRQERYQEGSKQPPAAKTPTCSDERRKGKDSYARQNSKPRRQEQEEEPEQRLNPNKCGKCGKKGHNAEECWSKKGKKETSSSFSATLRGWSCKVATADTQVSSLIGPKHMVRLQCLGLELPAMIDTGSQLTIMPLSFLLKARDAGADMDTLCKEVKAEQLEVFDASGNKMDFLGCMETKMELVGGNRGIIQMHVKRLRDEVVLLGTNALEVLGVKIIISSDTQAQTRAKQKSARDERGGNLLKEKGETPQATSMAVIAKRSYVKPRNCGIIQ
ncbi:Zinc knuckle, partial [Trichostrongylus colubriformis]